MELQTRRQEEKTAKDTQICETRTTQEMFFETNKKAPKTTCAKLTHTTKQERETARTNDYHPRDHWSSLYSAVSKKIRFKDRISAQKGSTHSCSIKTRITKRECITVAHGHASVVCMATLKDLPSVGFTAGNSAIKLQRTTRQRPQERNEVSKRRLIGPSPLSRRKAGGGASPGGEG